MKVTEDKIKQIRDELIRHIPAEVIQTALDEGCELYAVGGCIRDLLLNRFSTDIDLSVVGDAVLLARKTAKRLGIEDIAVYSRFGTALLKLDGISIEFATSRKESYNKNSRKPSEIIAVPIEIDLQRRDFTINALALGMVGPREGELIDLFNGLTDIEKGIIKTPLEPDRTFSDDPLRMIRAVRFAAEFNFKIHPDTWHAISDNLLRLKIVALQRIGDEFYKMLAGSAPVVAMELLIDSGLMDLIVPEVAQLDGVEQVGKQHHKDVLRHSLKVMQNVVDNTEDPIIRLAALLHDIGKPKTKRFSQEDGWSFHGHEVIGARMTHTIGRRLCIGKEQLNRLVRLVNLHMRPINLTTEGVTDSAIRRLMVDAGDDIDDQLILCRADITTANPNKVIRYLEEFDKMLDRMQDVEARDKMSEFQSPIRGNEIMELCGLPPGPMIGALKGRIEDAILDGEISYDYQSAKDYLMEIYDQVISSDIDKLLSESRKRSKKRKSIDRDFHFPE